MIEHFLKYCKQPIYNVKQRKINFKTFIKLYIMGMLSVVFISVPVGAFAHIFNITNNITNTTTKFILLGIFIVPVLEETLFRLLLKPSKKKVYIYFFVIVSWMSILIFLNKYLLAGIVTAVFILGLILILLGFKNIIDLNNNFKFIFYLSAGIFALVHINNLDGINFYNFFITPLLVVPQLIMGFVFAYTRMIYGFRYSVFLHVCVNMLALSPYIFINIYNNF